MTDLNNLLVLVLLVLLLLGWARTFVGGCWWLLSSTYRARKTTQALDLAVDLARLEHGNRSLLWTTTLHVGLVRTSLLLNVQTRLILVLAQDKDDVGWAAVRERVGADLSSCEMEGLQWPWRRASANPEA